MNSQSCQNVVVVIVARTKKLEPIESKFCVTYGQKLDPTDSITEPTQQGKTDSVYMDGWSYTRRRTCCQFTLTHNKSQSTSNQKLDVEIQKQKKIIHVETNTLPFYT